MNIEGVVFGDFDSLKEEMILTYRDDTPPEEKEQKVSLPFVQGSYDFSRILGEAVRENRELTYEFFIKENNVKRRKMLEVKYENMLLNKGFGRIYDTANPKYYYHGKCSEATVSFDESWRQLKLTVVFDCYPYMISELPEGHDIWDEIIFDLDVFQDVDFEINRQKEITLHNPGVPTVYPTIKTSSAMQIQLKGRTYAVKAGTTLEADIPLASGENDLIVTGNGTIEFEFYKELI